MILSLLLGLAHGASDAAAGMLVTQVTMLNFGIEGGWMILLYNGFAFGLMPFAGLLLDRIKRYRHGAALGLVLTAAGIALAWLNLRLSLLLAGLGSALLHSGGGAAAIRATPGKASAPGLFAAFGVIGLALGSQAAFYFSITTTIIFSAILITLALIIGVFPEKQPQAENTRSVSPHPVEIGSLIMLVAAVALRSYVWTGVDSVTQGYTRTALYLALAAGSGKLLGGFTADWVGWRRFAIGALALALIPLAIGNDVILWMAAGVFFLQSVTPLSLAAVGKLLPNSPALAASLVLGMGILLGGLPYMLIARGGFGMLILASTLVLVVAIYARALPKAQPV